MVPDQEDNESDIWTKSSPKSRKNGPDECSMTGLSLKKSLLGGTHLFPAELCKTLREQVEALSQENARLVKCVESAEAKALEASKVKVPSPLQGLGRASDLAANKIVELSKKVRELNAELASAQTRARSAEVKLSSISQEQVAARKEDLEGGGDAPNQVKDLTEKLSTANTKLLDARNHIQMLKHDLKMSQKALASELGDGTPVQTVTNPGWRGRAQHIITLQKKISELTEKLSHTNIPATDKANLIAHASQRQSDKERNAELTKELETVKQQADEAKRKVDAAKARIRVVSSELATAKTKLASLQDKTAHDEQLIAALTAQLNSNNEKSRHREDHLNKKYDDQLAALQRELAQEKVKTAQLQNIISDRDTKIARLEEKLNSTCLRSDHERPYSSCSSMDKGSTQTTSQDVLASASEAERIRLMELLGVVNRRLDDERHALDRCQEQLRNERHKCARLETKLARLELDKVVCNRGTGYKKPPPSKIPSQTEWEGLKDKTELLEEKCLVLQTRLDTLKQEKEEDCRMYMHLLEETRQAFLEHLRKST